MYILTIKLYNTNISIVNKFDDFLSAFTSAQIVANVLNNVMKLTRHSSFEAPFNHCDYYADLYNELSIIVKKEN